MSKSSEACLVARCEPLLSAFEVFSLGALQLASPRACKACKIASPLQANLWTTSCIWSSLSMRDDCDLDVAKQDEHTTPN